MSHGVARARRVVITGLGAVTCLGHGVQHIWDSLLLGLCGLTKLEGHEFEGLPCRIAGTVPNGGQAGNLFLDHYISSPERRTLSLATCFSLVAAADAIKDAGWYPETEEERLRSGVAVGMGVVPLTDILDTGQALRDQGYRRVSPHFVPKILVNMPAGHIGIKYGLKGVNHSVSTACTTGAHAIGDAARFIEYGDVDVMVCGSTESCINSLSLAGFARMRALATGFNDQPQAASRPFDMNRQGFVMSEGAAILVLEEMDHAIRRGAKIYAEVLGYGLSGDANHITAPSQNGDGALRCMQAALDNAKLDASELGYINAHATSTPLGDAAEARAITKLLAGNNKHVAISSTKGAVGHLLGASGSLEAILTIMAIHTGLIPPTLNCVNPDSEFTLNFVPNNAQQWPSHFSRRVALTNSFGFGGTNASLCFGSVLSKSCK